MEPRTIALLRYGFAGALLLFSLIVLGLSGSLISTIPSGFIVPDFLGLSLAVAVITMVIVSASIVIDFFRKGAITSMVAVEIGWSFFLLVLWVAAAGDTTAVRAGLSCSTITVGFEVFDLTGTAKTQCQEAQALIAFCWFNFLIMLAWHVSLIALAVAAYTRGNTSVWTGPVTGTDFFVVVAKPQSQMAYGGTPPQQQYTGSPVQQQYTGQTAVTAQYPPAGYSPNPAAAAQV
ncbi:hypothetical protein JB92DRAFT_2827294 [Gautieria morchelliformis]|nr:hypothetical protein JB92DRAFT_2827294 [Gautieria morchelliformis]